MSQGTFVFDFYMKARLRIGVAMYMYMHMYVHVDLNDVGTVYKYCVYATRMQAKNITLHNFLVKVVIHSLRYTMKNSRTCTN